MSNENHDTISDIVKRVRRDCNSYPLPTAAAEMLKLVREIDAAHKRELEDASEPVGNAAAMREALRTLRQRFENNVMAYQDRYFKFSGWHWHKKYAEASRWRDVFKELLEACDAALNVPSRNCDAFSKDKVLEILEDRSFSKEDTIEWLYAEAKGESDEQK